ncbi:MAG: transposase [Candidatus Kuenenia sp.]|nr:transposase [Candidatus Kuenenia hertensis]
MITINQNINMSNYRRYYIPNSLYFITAVTNNRLPLFKNEKNIQLIFDTLHKVGEIKPFDLRAYCVLHDHLHLLIGIGETSGYNITDIVHSLKRNFTINYKKAHNITHEISLWQKRFWDHIIRNENDFKRHMDYIHYNPVKHKITLSPEEYKYSSFNKWIEKGFYEKGWGHSEPEDLREIDYE